METGHAVPRRAKNAFLMLAVFLILKSGFAFAADNDSTGPEVDADGLCEAASSLCEQSCDLAKYTATQRSECGEKCSSSYQQCVKSAAMRGRTKSNVGDLGTGGVLKETGTQKKQNRKP